MRVIEAERLYLRHLSPEVDAEFILELLNDPAWIRNIGDKGVRTITDARWYIWSGAVEDYKKLGFGLYLVALKESDIPIGICGILKRDYLDDVDIGFAFLEKFRSKGYASESAAAVMNYARDALGINRIAAITVPENAASIKVLERNGFHFEKIIKLPGNESEINLFLCDFQQVA